MLIAKDVFQKTLQFDEIKKYFNEDEIMLLKREFVTTTKSLNHQRSFFMC